MRALGAKQEEVRKEVIRGKLRWTRSADTNPELKLWQKNAGPQRQGLKLKRTSRPMKGHEGGEVLLHGKEKQGGG